jgi:hypothetical protein
MIQRRVLLYSICVCKTSPRVRSKHAMATAMVMEPLQKEDIEFWQLNAAVGLWETSETSETSLLLAIGLIAC